MPEDDTEPSGIGLPENEPDGGAGDAEAVEQIALLREPADGTPEPLIRQADLETAIVGLAAGHGPVAVDAERASGYRYSQRAYLVQLRREGYGTVLIDPIALPDLSGLNAALGDVEWILHAANQDLACLAEIGLRPARLFDTELAGRLLGEERVALGTMIESRLGVRLEKGHSAADWSTRPLPHDWLVYAALDVELLVQLRDALAAELAAAGKTRWAEQDFEAARTAPPGAAATDPWRRTSGIHAVRNRRQLAAIRSLWTSRDELAAERDVAPGRLLPDSAIVSAARRSPADIAELTKLPVFGGRRASSLSPPLVREALESARNAARRPAATDEPDGGRLAAAGHALARSGAGGSRPARRQPGGRRDASRGASCSRPESAGRRSRSPTRLATAGPARRARRCREARRARCTAMAGRAHGGPSSKLARRRDGVGWPPGKARTLPSPRRPQRQCG